MTNQQTFLVVLRDLHNQMICQMPVKGVSLLWVVTNFQPVIKHICATSPSVAEMFDNGAVCGIEVQLL